MKKFSLLIFSMVLLFAGCQKDLQEQRGTSRLQLIAEITEDDDVKTYLSDNTVMWGQGQLRYLRVEFRFGFGRQGFCKL